MKVIIQQLGQSRPAGAEAAIDMVDTHQTVWNIRWSSTPVEKAKDYDLHTNLSILPDPGDSGVADASCVIGITSGRIDYGTNLSSISRGKRKAIITSYAFDKLRDRSGNYDPPELFWAFAILNICFQISIRSCKDPNCIGYGGYTIEKLLLIVLELKICDECNDAIIRSQYKYQLSEIRNQISLLRKPKEYSLKPSRCTAQLPALSMQIEKFVDGGRGKIFEHYGIIMVMHFLRDLIPFIEGLIKLGAAEESIFLLVKPYPYSQRTEVHSFLYNYRPNIRIEYLNILPPDDDLLEKVVSMCRSSSTMDKIMIIEDGGYVTPFLHRRFADDLKFCIGAVEQTTKGLDTDRKIGSIKIPILNVAKSKFKDEYEAPLVGSAIINCMQRLLSDEIFFGKKALVFGFGAIGRYVSYSLRRLGMIVHVIDTLPERVVSAKVRGFEARGRIAVNLVREADLIIGTTGKCSIKANVLNNLKEGAILISTSSDRIEVDINALERTAARNEYVEGLGTYFYIGAGNSVRRVLLLGDGYPINFYSGSGIPNKAIDPILAQLFIGAVSLSAGRSHKPGILDIMDGLIADNKLIEDFIKLHK